MKRFYCKIRVFPKKNSPHHCEEFFWKGQIDKLYFHQTEDTGFLDFQEEEGISGGGQTGTLVTEGTDADSDAFTRDDVNKLSGKVLYIENRAPVIRDASQTEDIKVVVTL